MRRALFLSFILGAIALAQDRTITVREVDVTITKAVIDFQPDGGCVLTAYAIVAAPSVQPPTSPQPYAFNGARCTAARNAVTQAAKNDLQVGTGASP